MRDCYTDHEVGDHVKLVASPCSGLVMDLARSPFASTRVIFYCGLCMTDHCVPVVYVVAYNRPAGEWIARIA